MLLYRSNKGRENFAFDIFLYVLENEKEIKLFYSELKAYSGVLDALRAGGGLTPRKSSFLADLRKILSISDDRHKAEVRRAINSEILNTVCEK